MSMEWQERPAWLEQREAGEGQRMASDRRGQSPVGWMSHGDFILRGRGNLWSLYLVLCSWLVSC